jgi:hypothetical protein
MSSGSTLQFHIWNSQVSKAVSPNRELTPWALTRLGWDGLSCFNLTHYPSLSCNFQFNSLLMDTICVCWCVRVCVCVCVCVLYSSIHVLSFPHLIDIFLLLASSLCSDLLCNGIWLLPSCPVWGSLEGYYVNYITPQTTLKLSGLTQPFLISQATCESADAGQACSCPWESTGSHLI